MARALRDGYSTSGTLGIGLGAISRIPSGYHPRMTATLCLVLIDPVTGEVEVANAGHIPPLFAGPGGAYHSLGNLLLGALPEVYTVDRLKLPPGGTLLLFTDGLVEDRRISLDESMENARRLAETVEDDLEEFADRILGAFGSREDDVALVVLRREP